MENVGYVDLDQRGNNFSKYVEAVNYYYKINGCTSEVQIDTLVLIYRQSRHNGSFNMLFNCHKKLLNSICFDRYIKYRRHLHSDDLDEIQSMVYGEFYRRVMAYKIPPEAPFSKYIKLYLKKWSNAYIKLMVKKRDRFIQYNEDN